MNGKLKDWSFSRTGESVLTITTRESCKKLWDALGDQEITFSIKRRVIPRSLNANNYAWSLIEKLAVAVKSDKDSVYEEMLRRYGTGETYTDEAGNECKVLFSLREGVPPALVARHYAETGVGYVEGKKFIHYRAIKGTSEYSTKEMSVFLDGIISECQEVGIETDTHEQIARVGTVSYGEDLMIEMLINEAVEGEERRNDMCRLYGALGAKTWISANGTTISIRKMDDRHIRNCIAMLQRNLPFYDECFEGIAQKYIALFEKELQTRYPPKDASEGFFDEEEDEFIAQSLL